MAPKTTLNAKNLETLGTKRLAELLMEISAGDANRKRRLRMELVGHSSGAELAREVRKRLSSIALAKSWIDWQKAKTVKADLEAQRKIIVENIARTDPQEAFELIWQFLSLADTIFERTDDSSGKLIASFRAAVEDAGRIAHTAGIGVARLVEKVFNVVRNNDFGQYDGLITAMVPALGETGLRQLQQCFEDWLDEPLPKSSKDEQHVVGWSSNGPVYAGEFEADDKLHTATIALREIADAVGDVDLYMAQYAELMRGVPAISAEIAKRLLAADRAQEALQMLDKAQWEVSSTDRWQGDWAEWQKTRVAVLEAMARPQEAQQFRWQCFETSLNDELLRDFLRRLPDFEDVEAEERARAWVNNHPDIHQALAFFLRYPNLAAAAKLVIDRASEINGDYYELMSPAAEVLADQYPLAATVLLRSMIDFTLEYGRSSRYKHAARHLADCGALVRRVGDYGSNVPTHDVYVADLRKRHGRKHGFWGLLEQ